MRRWQLLVSVLLALWAGTAAAGTSIGVGVFGGTSVPIVQDDNGTGSQFGLRAPVNLIPFLTVEPFFARSSLGSGELDAGGFTYERSGFDVTTFGVNAALGSLGLLSGFSFYPYAGIASYKLTRDGSEDVSEVGYNFGLGFGISPIPVVALNLRGEFVMVATGDTSRKFANVTLGATYKLFSLP